jgi:hypothetical protein
MSFSERYRPSIRCAIIWLTLLTLWCSSVLDLGECWRIFVCSIAVYVPLLLLIMFSRPVTPTRLDLLLIGWAPPVLFLVLLYLLPIVWHYRGLQ